MSDIVIRIEHVYKSFGEEEVLHDICHEFEAKQIHGIVGNNGSGKTVLMKCICGFMHPNRGTIHVDYEQVGKDVDFPKDMGIIIETPGFLPNLTGVKNLQLLASLNRKISVKEIREVIRRVGLDPDRKHICVFSKTPVYQGKSEMGYSLWMSRLTVWINTVYGK